MFQSFTSIIGPNGSGKSNVIDSMLFVFGYRASKIRSKKISVLLHKSENHTNVKCCSVAVHFARIVDIVRLMNSCSSFLINITLVRLIKVYKKYHDKNRIISDNVTIPYNSL